jgi:hypothetical protein
MLIRKRSINNAALNHGVTRQLIWCHGIHLLSSARHLKPFSSRSTISYCGPRTVKPNTFPSSTFGLAACLALSGCASIINGRHADVAFDTYPSNAHVVIHDNDGRQVASLHTPGVVSLKRNRRYFLPARYTATIEAPGYALTQVPIRSTINPWILGNIVIGGVPGLIVDNATGAAWRPRHSQIHSQLAPISGPGQEMMYSNNHPMPPGPVHAAQGIASRSGQEISR